MFLFFILGQMTVNKKFWCKVSERNKEKTLTLSTTLIPSLEDKFKTSCILVILEISQSCMQFKYKEDIMNKIFYKQTKYSCQREGEKTYICKPRCNFVVINNNDKNN